MVFASPPGSGSAAGAPNVTRNTSYV